jgi:hypothetical protein
MELFMVFYLVCFILSYGMAFAHFQEITQGRLARRNKVTAVMVSILGPCSLLIALGCTRFARHGLRFKY